MKKITLTIIALAVCISVFANNYVVQLGVFQQPVNVSTYFYNVDNVQMTKDRNNFFIYYVSGFTNENQATSKKYDFQNMGYNAQVIDMDAIIACKQACSRVQPTYYDDVNTNYDVTMDCTNSYKPHELQDYEKVRVIMMDDPSTMLSLQGNEKTIRRIQCYLNSRGVSNCRIEITNRMTCIESARGTALWVVNTSNQVIDIDSQFKRIKNYSTPTVRTTQPARMIYSMVD